MPSLAESKKLFYPIACGVFNNTLVILPSKILFVGQSPAGSRSWRIAGLELDL